MMKTISLAAAIVASVTLARLAPAAEGTFDSNGVNIRYVTEGEGEAVVLVHGWMGDSSMWGHDASGNTKLDASGTKGFRLIAMDCRGHGKSDKPHDANRYGPEMAEDVVRLLDHLKIGKAHLIGYSMGAFIVGRVAATHPERVLSIIYGGQAPIIAGAPELGSNEVEIFAKAVDEGKGLGPYLLAVMPKDKPKLNLEQANALAKLMYGDKDVKAFALAGLSLPKLAVKSEDLRKCTAPTLFLYGGNESDYVKKSVSTAHTALGRGEVRIVPGGDHMTTLAKPEFGVAIVSFLKANRSGSDDFLF